VNLDQVIVALALTLLVLGLTGVLGP